MARSFLTPINLNSLELQNFIVHNVNADPTGVLGRLYYNTANNTLKYYDGAWKTIATGGSTFTLGSTSVSIGGTTTSVADLTLTGTSTWQGTDVGVLYGGTGTSDGSITGTGALTFTAGGSNTNVVLVPNGTGSVNVSSKTIINVADPVNDTDAANKRYVDNVSLGVNAHDAVVALISGTIAGTYTAGTTGADGGTGVGAYITYTSTGTTTVDTTVTLAQYDRVLVSGGVTADSGANSKANGIYIVTTAGATGVATVLTRALDFDNSIFGDVTSGDLIYVTSGTANGGTQWVQTVKGTATSGSGSSTRYCVKIGTDAISFTQFSGVSSTTAGAGLVKNGNAFDVNPGTGIAISADAVIIDTAWAGQTAITTLGTIATGTWNATTIGTAKGGTGLTGFTSGGAVYASSASVLTTGTLPVTAGGTGAATLTSAGILRGNGTSAISVASASDIVAAISTTAVTNATNAANVTTTAQSTGTYYPAFVSSSAGSTSGLGVISTLSFAAATGTLSATVFSGSGASLTSLNGSNISTGTVADARIASALTGKTYNGLTVTSSTGTLTIVNGGTLATAGAFSTTLTSTALTNVTLPTTGTLATLAGSEALTNKTYNGLTVTTSTGTLTVVNGKTLTVNKSITLEGTDSTTMTFPSTNATIARTDAAQTFTGVQTFTSPSVTTSLTTSSTTFALLDSTATTLTFGGAATSLTIGGASNATTNIGNGGASTGNSIVNVGTGNVSTGTVAVNIGTGTISTGTITTTIGNTVKLPQVGTSGFVKLGTGGILSADTNTYLTSTTGVTTVNGSSGAIGATANSNGALTRYYRTTSANATSTTINHGYGQWVLVQVFDSSTGALVDVDVVNSSTSGGTTTVTFATAPALNAYTIVIIG